MKVCGKDTMNQLPTKEIRLLLTDHGISYSPKHLETIVESHISLFVRRQRFLGNEGEEDKRPKMGLMFRQVSLDSS